MKNSNDKGQRYMLAVCRLLSHWVAGTGLEARAEDLHFRPRSTLLAIEGHWRRKGDLMDRPGTDFPLCVECKKHEKGDLDGLFDAPKWIVWEWWEQAKSQARAVGDAPALIFCRNLRENRIVLPTHVARCLEIKATNGPLIDVTRPDGEQLTICLLADLLALPSSHLKRLRAGRSSAATSSSKRSLKRTTSRS